MIQFHLLQLTDLPKIKPFFNQSGTRLCDQSSILCMWRGFFATEIAFGGESLYIKQYYDGVPTFMTPLGGNFFAGVEAILSYCKTYKHRALFSVVARDELETIHKRYTVKSAEPMRDWSDYLYNSQDLIELRGRRFHSIRNHISRFEREYPVHNYGQLTDIAAARAFIDGFYQKHPPADAVGRYEHSLVNEVLERWNDYRQVGGVLMADGKMVSLSIGEVVGDTLFVHIEKADIAYHGAYQKTVNCFARMAGANTAYINREEDMGIEGLRKSKLSYHPVALLEKYMVEIDV